MCIPWLPLEMWIYVFAHLPLSDKLRLRTTSKYFRDLVDSDLWTDRIMELCRSNDNHEDHEKHWDMVRRLGVTSLRLCYLGGWAHITKGLPRLTSLKTLIINDRPSSYDYVDILTERLITVDLEGLSVFLPQQLKNLTVCHSMIRTGALPDEFPPDSPFRKLKSLTFHNRFGCHPVKVLHFLLSSLPQLQHLSLPMNAFTSYKGHISDLPPINNGSLSSLELVDCKLENLPMDLMAMLRTLPFLRSLAIFCEWYQKSQELPAWLRDLPSLNSLLVRGVDVHVFVNSIPSTVTRLALLPRRLFHDDMISVSVQLPNLQHLHLQPFDIHLGSYVALIPQLYPGLKTLRLCHEMVPRDAFLRLASLKKLQVLEMEDVDIWPTSALMDVKELTNNRFRIIKRPWEYEQRLCRCTTYSC